MSEIAGFIKKVWFQLYFVALKANKFKLDNYSVIVNCLPFLLRWDKELFFLWLLPSEKMLGILACQKEK